MGLFGRKRKELRLPENGHWVLVCKQCGERLPIPPHTEMPGLIFDFQPDSAVLQVTYGISEKDSFTLLLDGLRNFFDVDVEEAGGIVLAASFRDNVKMIHRHIARHYPKFYAMYLQAEDFFKLTYTKIFAPGGLTYENGQLLQLETLVKLAARPGQGKLDPNRAEIPGFTWPL